MESIREPQLPAQVPTMNCRGLGTWPVSSSSRDHSPISTRCWSVDNFSMGFPSLIHTNDNSERADVKLCCILGWSSVHGLQVWGILVVRLHPIKQTGVIFPNKKFGNCETHSERKRTYCRRENPKATGEASVSKDVRVSSADSDGWAMEKIVLEVHLPRTQQIHAFFLILPHLTFFKSFHSMSYKLPGIHRPQ